MRTETGHRFNVTGFYHGEKIQRHRSRSWVQWFMVSGFTPNWMLVSKFWLCNTRAGSQREAKCMTLERYDYIGALESCLQPGGDANHVPVNFSNLERWTRQADKH
jgi:hypothetical protein